MRHSPLNRAARHAIREACDKLTDGELAALAAREKNHMREVQARAVYVNRLAYFRKRANK